MPLDSLNMTRWQARFISVHGLVFATVYSMDKSKQPNLIKTISLAIILTLVSPVVAMAEVVYLQHDYKQPKPFLYEVKKDGKVSHILGSMHAGIPLESFPDSVFQLSAQASNLAFESDPEEFKNKYSKPVQDAKLYPPGHSLEQELSANSIRRLKEIYGEKGFEKLNKYRPWVIEMELSRASLASTNRYVSSGIDMTLWAQAKKGNKPLSYLDDSSKKVEALVEDFSAADLDKLLSYPDPMGHIKSCFLKAQRSYLAGSKEGFEEYNKVCETKIFLSRLQSRTISWIPKMEPLLKKGNAFIVVGADHMNGPNGIEALLAAKGYDVKRIGSSEVPMQNYIYKSTESRVPSVK